MLGGEREPRRFVLLVKALEPRKIKGFHQIYDSMTLSREIVELRDSGFGFLGEPLSPKIPCLSSPHRFAATCFWKGFARKLRTSAPKPLEVLSGRKRLKPNLDLLDGLRLPRDLESGS
jgi:hypothetical protein